MGKGTARPRRKRSAFRLPLLSGILLGTSYIPFPPWALLFGFVPLWSFWLREESPKRVLWGGWFAQAVLALIGFHWVAYTAHEFGHLPWTVSVLVLALFCAAANLHIPLAGLAWSVCRRRLDLPRWACLGLLPAFTALWEYFWPMLFPWNLGYPWLWSRLPVYQLAEFTGFAGLSAVTVSFNLLVLVAWEHRRSRKGIRILGAGLAFFAAINALGWMAEKRLPPPDAETRVQIVQGNIGNLAKERAERGERFREGILTKYLALTGRGMMASGDRRPDFVIWPESAFPDTISPGRMDEGNIPALRRFLRRRSVALVTGARGHDPESGKMTNSFVVLDERGELTAPPYHKSVLLAFGEYVPGASFFPGLKRWFPHTADFAPGHGPETKPLHDLVLGPQICYEGLFPEFSRSLADRGAQFFVNVTNDSWFGTWAEPYQHLYMTLARGIEFRRAVIRATNTGISTVMLADGTLLERSPLQEAWTHLYVVPYRKDPPSTFFQEYGHRIVPALLLLAPCIFLATGWRGGRPSP